MFRTAALSMLSVLACLACSTPSLADPPGANAASTRDLRWQKKLEGATRLELHDVNGSVHAEPTDDDTLSIVAVKTGRESDFARVTVKVREEGGSVIVCALWPGQSTCPAAGGGLDREEKIDVKVDFVVRVPAKVSRLEAETMNGSLTATNVRAEARLRTMNGSIDVRAAGAVDAQAMNGSIVAVGVRGSAVHLATKNGRVELALPPDADADVAASTMRGSITSACGNITPARLPGMPVSSHFKVGAGGVPVALETMNGDVVLKCGAS